MGPRKRIYTERRAAKIKRGLKKLLIVCSVILFFVGIYQLMILVRDSQYFALKEIHITGNEVLSKEYLIKRLSLRTGMSIFNVDIDKLYTTLTSEPWINRAKVERKLPGMLAISIQERKAFAVLVSDGEKYLLDKDGFIIERYQGEEQYPLIKGLKKGGLEVGKRIDSEKLDKGLRVLKGIDDTDIYSSREIVSIDVSDTERIAARVGQKTLLKLDGNHIEREIARLKTVAKLLKKEKGRIEYVDLSFNKRVVVKLF
jgi:cell division septal protein FtsQ